MNKDRTLSLILLLFIVLTAHSQNYKSGDLINWTSSVINIRQKYAGQENLKRVWAPQTISGYLSRGTHR